MSIYIFLFFVFRPLRSKFAAPFRYFKYFIGKSFVFHDYMKHDPDLPALIYFDFVNNEEQ